MSEYKVLIPLDGSRLAEHSLAFLPALSYQGDLDVTLISVVDFPDDVNDFALSEDQDREHNLLASYLREVAEDLQSHLGATVRYEIPRGSAAPVILEKLESAAIDLLVISTHGRSGAARWQRGAVADRVIRNADCPVLVVGPRAMEKGQWLEAGIVPPFKQILVPLDGSEMAETALPKAVEYAEHYSSRLHLVRVLPYIPLASSFWVPPETLGTRALESGREYLSKVASTLTVPVETHVTLGSPSVELRDYIDGQNIDLVVMTSRGRGGIARAALGSVADRLVGAGPPVLVIRA